MKHSYHLTLDPKFATFAKEHDFLSHLKEHTTTTITANEETIIPDVIGLCIGNVIEDNMNSSLKDDKDNTKLKLCIESGLLVQANYNTLINNNHLTTKTFYAIPYLVDESTATLSTFTSFGPTDAIPDHGHYLVTYEILTGDENYTRRFVFTSKSKNMDMVRWFNNFKDTLDNLQDLFEENNSDIDPSDKELMQQFSFNKRTDCIEFTMFDALGTPNDVEFYPDDFKNMIRSVRQLDCKYISEL